MDRIIYTSNIYKFLFLFSSIFLIGIINNVVNNNTILDKTEYFYQDNTNEKHIVTHKENNHKSLIKEENEQNEDNEENIKIIEKEIEELQNYIINVKTYYNPYNSIRYRHDKKVENEINEEDLLSLINKDIIIFSQFGNINKDKFKFFDFLKSYGRRNSDDMFDTTKKNMYIYQIYIEKRKFENNFLNSLKDEHKIIFKENNYKNIYEIIENKLSEELNLLYKKLLEYYIE